MISCMVFKYQSLNSQTKEDEKAETKRRCVLLSHGNGDDDISLMDLGVAWSKMFKMDGCHYVRLSRVRSVIEI
jgi:predicted esterase